METPPPGVALVTGAPRRLGRAIALRLAAAGRPVAVHFRSDASGARKTIEAIRAAGGVAEAFAGDLTRPGIPEALVASVEKSLGSVTVLVNNASIFRRVPFAELDAEEIDLNHALHVRAPLLLARAVAPGMRAAGGGRIVNLIDIHVERPMTGYAAYAASKAGLANLTLALARELAPEVTVNAVSPGAILLPEDAPPEQEAALVANIPAGRLGRPEEIAAAVAFFTEGPAFVTGEILRVDGGRHLR